MNEKNAQTYQETLTFEGLCNQRSLAHWVKIVARDPIAQSVIDSQPFARLKKVSFLGAIDYLNFTQKMNKKPRSRAVHSLQVAGLASFISAHRNYNSELTRHLIIAGLLHDIGHPPLSHSVEPYLKDSFGYGHHEMGEKLLSGEHVTSKKLHKILSSNVDISFINSLISGNATDEDGGDLFSSPINIDTIEGITRSFKYVKNSVTNLNPIDIAYASFVDKSDTRLNTLDKFWKLKDYVYKNIINRDLGLIADYYSQHFFHISPDMLCESEIFDSELDWERKYTQLFYTLGNITKNSDIPHELINIDIKYTSRKYYIEESNNNIARYQCIKSKKSTKLELLKPSKTEQSNLKFT